MPTQEKYNGWTNYSTWNVMLWLDNDEPAYRSYTAAVERFRARKPQATKLPALRAYLIAKDALGNTTGDGVRLNTKCINWREIADAMWPES